MVRNTPGLREVSLREEKSKAVAEEGGSLFQGRSGANTAFWTPNDNRDQRERGHWASDEAESNAEGLVPLSGSRESALEPVHVSAEKVADAVPGWLQPAASVGAGYRVPAPGIQVHGGGDNAPLGRPPNDRKVWSDGAKSGTVPLPPIDVHRALTGTKEPKIPIRAGVHH